MILELFRLVCGIAIILIARWMYEISSIQDDMRAIKHWLYDMAFCYRWYNGMEFFHQIRGKRLLNNG